MLAASIALSGYGCALPAVNVPPPQVQSLKATLGEQDRKVISLQSAALMEYTGGGQHFKARENIILRRPANIRVEVMSALGVALVVAADGSEVAVFDPAKNTLLQGAATAEALDRYARIPMTPDATVRLMLGLAPNDTILSLPPDSTADRGTIRLLTYNRPDGSIDELGINGDGNLETVRETLANGQIAYEVHYSGYSRIDGGLMFPSEIDASFPRTGASVKFRYRNPSLNQDVPDSAFVLVPQPGTRRLNLSARSDANGRRG